MSLLITKFIRRYAPCHSFYFGFYEFFWSSEVSDHRIVNNHWHFICITWDGGNGNVNFYYEGVKQPSISGPSAKLSQRGEFSVGVKRDSSSATYFSSFSGKLSCVNVWSYVQSTHSIVGMTSGTMNVNGDFLAWREAQSYIVGNLSVVFDSNLYFPGNMSIAKIILYPKMRKFTLTRLT